MALENPQRDNRTITVTLSSYLANRLDKHVQPHQLSQFVQTAIEERLNFEDELAAHTNQDWLEASEPGISSDAQMESWLNDIRLSWSRLVRK
jgi:hypothetical protein